MAATIEEFIKALQQFPPDTKLVDRKMFAITKGGTAVYDLNLKCRFVGIAQYRDEGLVILVEYTEDLNKIANVTKLA
jgi:hypothetical protein